MSFHLRPLTAFNLSPAVLLSIAERLQCVLRRKEGRQLQIPVLSPFWVDCLKRSSRVGKYVCCPVGRQAQEVNTVLKGFGVCITGPTRTRSASVEDEREEHLSDSRLEPGDKT